MKRVYVKLLALILVSLFFLLGCGETTRTKPEKEEWKMGAGGWLGILDEENIYYFNNFTRSLYAKNIESGREILLFPWLLTCQDVTKIGGSYYFLVPDRIDGGRTLWKKNTFFIPTRLLSNAVNKYAVLGDTVIVKEWDNDDNLVLSFYTDDFRHRKVCLLYTSQCCRYREPPCLYGSVHGRRDGALLPLLPLLRPQDRQLYLCRQLPRRGRGLLAAVCLL